MPNRRFITMLEKPLVGSDERVLLMSHFNPRQSRYTGKTWLYPLNDRGTAIGDFVMFNQRQGLVIERDGSQGDPNAGKAIYEIRFRGQGKPVTKELVVDLLDTADPAGIGGLAIGSGARKPGVRGSLVFVRSPVGRGRCS